MASFRGWGIPLRMGGSVPPLIPQGPYPGAWLFPSVAVFPGGVAVPVQTFPGADTFPSSTTYPSI